MKSDNIVWVDNLELVTQLMTVTGGGPWSYGEIWVSDMRKVLVCLCMSQSLCVRERGQKKRKKIGLFVHHACHICRLFAKVDMLGRVYLCV